MANSNKSVNYLKKCKSTKILKTNILQLNDDCLGKILFYLELEDHLSVAQACVRFREVVKNWASVLYRKFSIGHLQSEAIEPFDNKIIALFNIICEHLHDVHINFHRINKNEFQYAEKVLIHKFCKMKALRKISFDLPYEFGQLQKRLSLVLQNVPHLKHLEQTGSSEESIAFRCVNLEELVLHMKINPDVLDEICILNQKLRVLELTNESQLSFNSISYCNNLEKLVLGGKINSKDLSDICQSNQKLRVLKLNNDDIGIKWLNDIVPHCKNLEELRLKSEIRSQDLVELCKSNKNLHHLDIRFFGNLEDIIPHCKNLEKFMLDSDNIKFGPLAELPKLQDLKIRIGNFKQYKITEQIIKNLAVRKTQQIIKLKIDGIHNFNIVRTIALMKSLKHLFICSYLSENVDSVEMLSELTELETLEIRSDIDIYEGHECYYDPPLLSILRSCTKLTKVIVGNLHIQQNYGFFYKATNVLQEVRNPTKQEPLKLMFYFQGNSTYHDVRYNEYLHVDVDVKDNAINGEGEGIPPEFLD